MPVGGSITTRLIALLTLCAALIIGLSLLLDYRLSRDQFLERLQRESDETIRGVIVDMENWLESVKSSTLQMARVLEQRDYSREGLQQMLRDVVDVNKDIFGATIALSQVGDSLGFAPYYHRRDGVLEYADLAGPELNYQHQPWYTDTVVAARPLWVEPYFDEAGGKILMTTFAVPVYRQDQAGERFLYAVVTADVALAELHNYLMRLRLGTRGFGILLSQNGIVLSSRDPANIMRHYTELPGEEPDATTWLAMFTAARRGEVATRQLECIDAPGRCVMRLGSLRSTGWPVGVVYSEDEMTAPLREFQLKLAATSLLTLLLMALAVSAVTRSLTRPLNVLAQASNRIAQGDLGAPLPSARGDDEVARLIRSFAAMKQDLRTYIADLEDATARRSRLEGELTAAREIQMAMLPHGGKASEHNETFRLWARVLPARSVGGDLYSYQRRGRLLFFAVGDVSDKGVPAALFMARATSLIQQAAATAASPANAMAALNNALAEGNENCMFITLFLGILDLDSLELRFSSAGHTAPSLVRDGAATSLAQDQGPALSLAPDLAFPVTSLQMQPGDRLAVFTDGIDEAFNERDEMFGIDRFNDTLRATLDMDADTAGESVLTTLEEFAGGRPRSDDICLMLLDITTGEVITMQASEEFSRGPKITGRVEQWLRQALAELALPQKTLGELLLVTEEIVSNVDKYAGLPADATITVVAEARAQYIEIEVRDGGIAFDPLSQALRSELGATTEEAAVGGLGVHIITAITDRQSYRRAGGCNILRVTKLLEDLPDQSSGSPGSTHKE